MSISSAQYPRNGNARRVMVTGLGAVTSLGFNVPDTWQAVLAGRSGVGRIRQFDSRSFPVHIGSEVDLGSLPLRDCHGIEKYLSRAARFGLVALDEAWRDAGLPAADLDPYRAGVCIGASTFPIVEENLPDPKYLIDKDRYNADAYLALCRARPDLLAQRSISSISTLLSLRYDLRGVSMSVQSACTSATQAIGEAFEMVRRGEADIIVTGGTDSMLSVICIAGFTLLGALSARNEHPEKASRPFDLKRDGFVLGEGAGIVVLEEFSHARRRGARIYAEIAGYGSSMDGYRFTDMHPEGLGAAACMRAALADAGLAPEDVGYINAHGTSTPQNDRLETRAIKLAFGEHAHDVAVSSNKSQLGHLVCAAGGIELILTALTVHHGILPPTINLENADPHCDLDYVPNIPRECRVDAALTNSFGFGGQNGTIAVLRWASEEQWAEQVQ